MDENLDRAFPIPVRQAQRWVLRNAAFVAARSPSAGRLAECLGAHGEVSVIPHHVPSWVCGERLPKERFVVGFAGRLVPEKGLEVLVQAVRLLDGPVDLLVAGDGPLRQWLLSQSLGEAKLRLLTGVAHDDMDDVYAMMDVLVLPSRVTPTWSEQFGRVLVEALSCNVPVVGSNTGEIPWVIRSTGGGMVFPDGDATALAECIRTLQFNPEARSKLAVQGSKRADELFGVVPVSSKLGALMERSRKRRSPLDRDERPRVALVAHGIHDRGGMERACAELIRNVHQDVRFVAITAELAPDLVPLVECWIKVRVPRRPIPLKFVSFFLLAAIPVRRADADIVHTVGAILLNRTDLATVQFCHAGARQALGALAPREAPVLRRVNTALHRLLALTAERWCFRPSRLRQFAPVSTGVAAEVTEHYPGIPFEVIANGVDIERFRPDMTVRTSVRDAEDVCDDDVVCVFVGGDWDRKGLALALEGLRLARAEGAPVCLWIVGSGDRRRFENIARADGSMPWVRFFGPRTDIERFYQAADIFVLPTQYETFSLVSYEAASCGLPIVGTAVSGVAELIGASEAGILVLRDGQSVGDAMAHLARCPDVRHRVGAEARKRAIAYTWTSSAQTSLQLYRSLLSDAVAS